MILVTTPIRALSPFPRLEYKPQRWKSYTAGVTLSCPRTALGIHWGSPCSCGPVPPLPSGHLGLLLPQGLSTHCFLLNITPRFLHTSCLTPNALTAPRPSQSAPLPCRLSITSLCLFLSEHLDQPKAPTLLTTSLCCHSPSVEMLAARDQFSLPCLLP